MGHDRQASGWESVRVQPSPGPAETPAARRLVLVRHAAAEHTGPSDSERALAEKGRLDATEAGEWLASRGVRPDHALVSGARRTRETWEALAAAAGWDVEPDLSAALYSAGLDTALDLMREVPDEVTTLLVVGHNPTIASLVQLLDDGEGDPAVAVELATGGFPAGAVAELRHDGDWADLSLGAATVVAYHVGRG